MFVPNSWRETFEEAVLVLLGFLSHIPLVLCIVADAYAWSLMPEQSQPLGLVIKAAEAMSFVPLFLVYAIFIRNLWHRLTAPRPRQTTTHLAAPPRHSRGRLRATTAQQPLPLSLRNDAKS